MRTTRWRPFAIQISSSWFPKFPYEFICVSSRAKAHIKYLQKFREKTTDFFPFLFLPKPWLRWYAEIILKDCWVALNVMGYCVRCSIRFLEAFPGSTVSHLPLIFGEIFLMANITTGCSLDAYHMSMFSFVQAAIRKPTFPPLCESIQVELSELVLFKCLIIVLSAQLQHDLVYCLGGRLILNLTLLVWVIVFTCIHIYCHCHRYHQQYRANWYCCAVFDVFLLIRDTINAAKFFFSLLNQL